MKAEKCLECGGWAEPPFLSMVSWDAPATREDALRFAQGGECEVVRIERPLCRYCAHAKAHGGDYLTEEAKDALDLSDEG